MNTDAIWVAHAGEQNGVHYYGILRASMLAEQGEGKDETPRLRIRRKTPAVEQPVGADPYAALDNCPACDFFLVEGDCINPKCPLIQPTTPIPPSNGTNANYDDASSARAAALNAMGPLTGRRKGQRQQVKQCSRCGAFGHRMDSRKCPMFSEPSSHGEGARWINKRKHGLRNGVPEGTRASAQRARIFARIMRKYRFNSRRAIVEREPWNPPYIRETSPGRRAMKKRRDRRRTFDIHHVLDADNSRDAARKSLMNLGFIREWHDAPCLTCAKGKYKAIKGKSDMLRCGTCKRKTSLWRGSAFSGTGLTETRCLNLCVGFAARQDPTITSIDKGVNYCTVAKYFKYFRCAQAWKGIQLRSSTCFQGTAQLPVEVELDETVLKSIKVFVFLCRCN